MTPFTIASFNVKNLIGPDQENHRLMSYSPEEYALNDIVNDADQLGAQCNDAENRSDRYSETDLGQIMAHLNLKGDTT